MKITRASPLTGRINTMEIDVTPDQLKEWQGGALIQNVLPHLTADEREFLMTGITPDEWDAAFAPDEPEPDDAWDDLAFTLPR